MNESVTASSIPPIPASHRLSSPALFALDSRGLVISASATASSCWQTDAAKLAGLPFVSLLNLASPTTTLARFEARWEMLLATALGRTIAATARLPDGATFEVTLRIEESTGGNATYLAWIDNPARHQESTPPMLVDSGLALLADQGAVGFFDLNFKGGHMYYSPAWKRMLGYTDAELVNTYDSWLRLIHPDDSAASPDHPPRKHDGTGTRSFSAEIRMKHRRGHYVWVQCIGTQIFGANGELERVTAMQIDISERKDVEEQSLASEDRLHRLVSENALAVFDIDFSNGSNWFSPAWHQLLGTPANQPLNLDTLVAALPEDATAQDLQSLFLSRNPGQGSFIDIVKLRDQAGHVRPVLLGVHRQLVRKNELKRVVGFCCPLPEHFENAAENSIPTSLVEGTLAALNEAVIVADPTGQILHLNASAERLTGCRLTDARGHIFTEIFRLADRTTGQLATNAVNLALSATHPVQLCTAHNLLPVFEGATPQPIVWSVQKFWTNEHRVTGFVIVFRNPEELSLSPDELLKTNRLEALGTVSGGIAHDFNNLLTTILGGISHAKDNHDSSFLVDSERACLAAKSLTRQLITVARGGESTTEVLAPAELLQDAARLARAGGNHEIHIDVPENIAAIRGDRAQMLQIFQNLVINAVQALPTRNGRIELSAYTADLNEKAMPSLVAGKYVIIEITDNGCGIPPENLAQIFQPFFTTKKQGTGIGLATVQNLVQKHGGQITVDSTVGVGTTFRVYLPEATQTATVDVRRAPVLRFGTGRILLMDDDADICRLVGAMLESMDYTVDTAPNGEEAMTLYRRSLNVERPYDVVILDLTVVGGMGGEEAFHKIRQMDPDARVIIASGYDDDEMARRFMDMGCCGYLSKPFRIADLGRIIKTVLDTSDSGAASSPAAN